IHTATNDHLYVHTPLNRITHVTADRRSRQKIARHQNDPLTRVPEQLPVRPRYFRLTAHPVISPHTDAPLMRMPEIYGNVGRFALLGHIPDTCEIFPGCPAELAKFLRNLPLNAYGKIQPGRLPGHVVIPIPDIRSRYYGILRIYHEQLLMHPSTNIKSLTA